MGQGAAVVLAGEDVKIRYNILHVEEECVILVEEVWVRLFFAVSTAVGQGAPQ